MRWGDIYWWMWRRLRPHYMMTPSKYKGEEAWSWWWGPFNVTSMKMATILWVTHFCRSYSLDFRVGRWKFVFATWRERPKSPPLRVTVDPTQ